MSDDYPKLVGELNAAIAELHAGAPETMKGFSAMARGALKPGALDPKTKELIALAIGVAARCDGCLGFHAKAAVKHGATRDEVMEALGMCVYMGGGPSMVYSALALKAFDQFKALAEAAEE